LTKPPNLVPDDPDGPNQIPHGVLDDLPLQHVPVQTEERVRVSLRECESWGVWCREIQNTRERERERRETRDEREGLQGKIFNQNGAKFSFFRKI